MAKLPNNLPPQALQGFTKVNETLVRDVKSKPTDRIELEIGDIKQPDFKPQAKIKRWGNEVNLSIRRITKEANAVTYSGDKVIYETDLEDVHFYERNDVGEDGGLEIELHLKELTPGNRFDFSINTKGLVFGKQGELTEEEIAAGTIRPENVINSYAVYMEEESPVNIVGGQEYKAGKVCHIYRPHITDSAGNETWGDIEINEELGILTVIVPPIFLENAVYPVIVDPTIGYTGIGATTDTSDIVLSAVAGRSITTPVSTATGYQIDSIHYYTRTASGTTNFKGVIYTGTTAPVTNLNVGSVVGVTTTPAWRVSTTTYANSTTDILYGMVSEAAVTCYVYRDANINNRTYYGSNNNYTTPSNSPGVNATANGNRRSMYYTYTFTGGGTAPTVTTQAAGTPNMKTYITVLNGNITATSPNAVQRGFVWDTSTKSDPGSLAPDLSGYANVITEAGSFATGAYTANLTIAPNTTYYVRAWALNSSGYDYGTEVNFTTGNGYPQVLNYTDTVTRDDDGAFIRGYLQYDGELTITRRGFVYGTTSQADPDTTAYNATGYDSFTTETGTWNDGIVFSTNIADLQPDTLYYYRAYAQNSTGYQYSGERTFRTSREGLRRIDTGQLIFSSVSPLGPSFFYMSQEFIARGPKLERAALAFAVNAAITGTARILICPDDGSGNPNESSPLYTGGTFTVGNVMKKHYIEPNITLTPGTKYHIVADGSAITVGSAKLATRATSVSGEEGAAALKYSATGASWTTFTSSLDIYLEFSYTAPTVSSSAATSIQSNSAQFNGNITALGDGEVTERGFVISTSSQTAPAAVAESATLIDTEGFETNYGEWVSSGFDGWTRFTGSTPSGSTGPTAANVGSYYVYVETSSGTGSFTSGNEDYLTYTLPSSQAGKINFDIHKYGTDQGLTLFEGWDGNKWIPVFADFGTNVNAWEDIPDTSVRFDGYSQVRFRNVAKGGFLGDVGLDDLNLYTITPEAIAPTPANTTYSNVVGTTGSYSTGAYASVITGLEPNTTYYYRAYAKSGAGYVYSTEQSFTTDQLPTTALNTADATNFGTDKTPTLAFTGTEPNSGADLTYDIAIYGSASTSTTSSFAGSGSFQGGNLINNTQDAVGQTFKGKGGLLHSVSFDLAKIGSPTGPIVVKIWAHSGTYGSTGIPTGSVLATSEPIDASTLPTWSSTSTFEFFFDASEQFQLQTGVPYVATIHHDGISGNYPVVKRYQDSLALHEGNFVYTATGASWSPIGTWDNNIIIKEVDSGFLLYKSSDTDAGFTGTPDSTDPFTSGQQVTFTVQAGDELKDRTYTWKARAWNPVNTNDTDYSWSATRTFTVDAVATASQTKSLTYKSIGTIAATRSLKYTTTQPLVCLAGWDYKRQFEVMGSPDGELTDYTIPVTVNYGSGTDSGQNVYLAGKCKTDFSDVRFTAEDGATLLEHFLDYKTDSSVAYFWVKIPYLPQSGSKFFYIAYGNSGASAASTAIKTFFPKAIDFASDTLIGLYSQDSNENYTTDGATNSIVFGNGAARSNNWKGVNVGNFSVTPNSHAVGFTLKVAGTQAEILGIGVDNQTTTIPPTSDNRIQQAYGTQSYNTTDGMPTYTGAGAEQYLEGELNLTGTYNYLTIIHDEDAAVNPTDTYRNVRLRKYTTNEPSINTWLPEWFCGGPSVALNTADGFSFGTDTTPTIEFTGTDTESNDIRYTVEINTHPNMYDVDALASSYSAGGYSFTSGGSKGGQTFMGDGRAITNVGFLISKSGNPPGPVYVEIYNATEVATGIYTGTGSVLGTSSAINIDDLGAPGDWASLPLTDFDFPTPVSTVAGNMYVAVVVANGGDNSNRINVHVDYNEDIYPHTNAVSYTSSWSYQTYYTRIYYIRAGEALISAVSGTDAGFANTVDGGDTDPFTSGQKISYTVQGADALSPDVYYYRVYGIDPTGGNTYGQYSETRSFEVYDSPFQKNLSYAVKPYLKYFSDDFDDGLEVFWTTYGSGAVVTNGEAVLTSGAADGSNAWLEYDGTLNPAWFDNAVTYEAILADSYVLYELTNADIMNQPEHTGYIGSYGWHTDTYDNEYIYFGLNNGNIGAYYGTSSNISGGTLVGSTATYSPTSHRWLRIRESSGTLYWEYSSDCYNWSILASLVHSMDLRSQVAAIWVKTTGVAAQAETMIVDNFNNLQPLHQRSLQYAVTPSIATTRDIDYMIVDGVSVTKSLQYNIPQPSVSDLNDNFNDNSIDSGKWATYQNSATVSETNGQIEIAVTANTSGAEGDLYTVDAWDLTTGAVTVNVKQVAYPDVDTLFIVQEVAGDRLMWLVYNTTATAYVQNGYSTISSGSGVSVTPGDNLYFRIREASGTVYFDYSTDGGQNWTNAHTELVSNIPWDITNSKLVLANYEFTASGATTETTSIFDNVNVIPFTKTRSTQYMVTSAVSETRDLKYTVVTSKLPGTQIDGYKPNGSLSGTDVNATTWKGQSFTGDGNDIGSVSFYFTDIGTPVGDVFVEIYAHTNTFGTTGRPGNASSALATSRVVDGSTLNVTGYPRTTFVFDTPYTTVNGTKYVAVLRGPSTSGSLRMQVDTSSPTHPGNACQTTNSGSTWTASSTWDYKFEVNQAGGTIRELEYAVVPSVSVTKSVQYTVTATSAAITKSLQYCVPVYESKTIVIDNVIQDTWYGDVLSPQFGPNPTSTSLPVGGWGDYHYAYIEFDWGTFLPSADRITQIDLNMWSLTNNKNNPSAYIRRITESWDEDTLTNVLNPASTTTDQVLIPHPYTATGWKTYNVTNIAVTWFNGTNTNYGFKFHPTANNETNGSFASSNNSDTTIHPYMELTYDSSPYELRDLTYAVSPSYSQTKDLTYLTDATLSVTKSAKYTVIDTPAAKTRSLQYVVSPVTTEVENRSLKYTIATTPAEKTRGVDYYVVNLGAITKQAKYTVTAPVSPLTRSVEYTILIADNVQKATDYYILTTDSQARGVDYYVIPTITETRDLTYTVDTTVSTTRDSQYAVVDPNAAAKSAQYTVETTASEQRGVDYQIIKTYSDTRGVDYAVLTQPSETRNNKYTVTSAVATTRDIAYIVIGPTNMELQMKYTVFTTPAEKTRSVDYYILDTSSTTKSSQYAMVPAVSETRTVDYAIVSSVSETRDILYVVAANTYSREDTDVLRTDTADLSNVYTTQEYTNVDTSDDVDTKQGGTSRFQVHQYRVYNTNATDFIRITWEGSPIVDATVSNPLVIQMYNYNTQQWETRDSSNTAVTTSDTTFSVTIDMSGSDFYGPYNEVCTRVFRYQEDPEVLMTSVSSITPVSAYVYATTVSDGGLAIIDKGFVYGTSSQSTPGNVAPASSGYTNAVSYSPSGPSDPWTQGLVGLTQTTTYYVRAYLQTSLGYEYSDNQLSFTTSSSQGGGGEI